MYNYIGKSDDGIELESRDGETIVILPIHTLERCEELLEGLDSNEVTISVTDDGGFSLSYWDEDIQHLTIWTSISDDTVWRVTEELIGRDVY